MTNMTVKKAIFSILGALLGLAAISVIVLRLIMILRPNIIARPSVTEALIFAAFTYLSCLCFRAAFRENSTKIMRIGFALIFAAYIYLLLFLALFSFDYGRNFGIFSEYSSGYTYALMKVNFIPFKTIGFYIYCLSIGDMIRISITNLLGNIAAFAPFALFLPLLFKKMKKSLPFIITAFLTSLMIEVLQFVLQVGSSDIDDLILNCCGAALFFFILRIKPIRWLISKITFLEY